MYIGMKNDLSFLLKDEMNLYEHQSTFSPNFPLRGLFYFADLYRRIVGNHKDLYSRRLIKLPTPQFIVFYNGVQKEPERRILTLSDAFAKKNTSFAPSLECTAIVLNINCGSNRALLEKCTKLREYSQFVGKVRENLAKKMRIEGAVDAAVMECIKEGILADLLKGSREEVMNTLLTEYNEELHLRCEREIAREDGATMKVISVMRKKLEKGISIPQIAEWLEEEPATIECLYHILEEHQDWDDEEICTEYYRGATYDDNSNH